MKRRGKLQHRDARCPDDEEGLNADVIAGAAQAPAHTAHGTMSNQWSNKYFCWGC